MKRFCLLLTFLMLPFCLNAEAVVGKWQVFFSTSDKLTAATAAAASQQGAMPDGSVDFKLNGSFRNLKELCGSYQVGKTAALLHTTITVPEARKLNIGAGCDWYMSIFCNGKMVMSNEPGGSRDHTTHTPMDYQVTLELKGGVNHLTFLVRPGYASWTFAFALTPSPEFWPESSDGKRAFFQRLFPEKPETFNIFPYLSHLQQTSALVSMEFADEEAAGLRFRAVGSKEWRTIAPERREGLIRRKKLYHFNLNDLKPGTAYECIVDILVQSVGKVPVPMQKLTFKTLPDRGSQHKLLIIGDTQVLPYVCIAGVEAALDFAPDAELFVHLGDVQSFITAPVQNFFRNVVDLVSRSAAPAQNDGTVDLMPVLMVRGNHDYRGKYAEKFTEYFHRAYRAFRVGDIFYIVLDTGEHLPTSYRRNSITYFNDFKEHFQRQREWLKGVLVSPECRSAKRRIVISHATPLTYESHFRRSIEFITDNAFFGENPKCKIDLWIAGHIHTAFRFHPEEKTFYGRKDNYLKRYKANAFRGINFPIYVNDGPGGAVQLSAIELKHDADGMEIICRDLPSGKVLDHVRLDDGKNFSVKSTTFVKY